ncbi:CYCLOPS protein, partial [Trifolium pratense]
MEGRGFSGLFKNSSEELFLKTVMESPIGMPVPTMDMIGFKTVSQSFRADSEELFKRWLTTDQEASFYRYHMIRKFFNFIISTEIVNMSNQQHVGVASDGRNNDKSCIQNNFLANDVSDDFNFPIRDPVDRELQSSNLFLAK